MMTASQLAMKLVEAFGREARRGGEVFDHPTEGYNSEGDVVEEPYSVYLDGKYDMLRVAQDLLSKGDL